MRQSLAKAMFGEGARLTVGSQFRKRWLIALDGSILTDAQLLHLLRELRFAIGLRYGIIFAGRGSCAAVRGRRCDS
eukprot:scaffold3468_cov108-Skeletonema_marinoi.AAC.1